MSGHGGHSYVVETPVFRPSKEDFSRPFCDYVNKVLKKNPDLGMFKVVPPAGWKPRKAPIRLTKLDIQCPIKQHAYGTKGCYRCILVEQKSLSADQFREVAEDNDHAPPKKVRDGEDNLLERSFWSSVTINPPLYGADTPMSLFDDKLPYGWNLKHLDGCLLKRPDVPQVPGVTTPMTYFGMWKSYFAWHVEDADLFSINYLHFGAPKVWYCVSPSQRAKFERMCQSIFPELHKGCHAFMRHKDILLSPGLLRTYGIEYMQAKQEPNEFIVLNAAAYHAGYNMGFNCAEAVNFAPPSWIDIGRNVVRCKCRDDGVRLSMRLFGCSSGSSASTDDYTSSEDDVSVDEDESSQEVSSGGQDSGDEAGSGSSSGRKRKQQRQRSSSKAADMAKDAEPVVAQRRSKRAAAAAAAAAAAGSPSSKRARHDDAVAPRSPRPQGPRQTRTARAAAEAAKRMRRTNATAEARARLAARRGDGKGHRPRPSRAKKSTADLEDSLQRAAAAAAAIRARQQQAASQGGSQGLFCDEQLQEPQQQQQQVMMQVDTPPVAAVVLKQEQARSHSSERAAAAAAAVKSELFDGRRGAAAAAAAGADADADDDDEVDSEAPDSPTATKAKLSNQGKLKHEVDVAAAAAAAAEAEEPAAGFGGSHGGGGGGVGQRRSSVRMAAAAAAAAAAGGPVGEAPKVILGEDSHGSKYFYMVQVLREHKAKRRGHLVMRWLKEGRDGLFRPSTDTWEEPASCLLGVRTQWVQPKHGKPGGYQLLTLRSRILDTQLLD